MTSPLAKPHGTLNSSYQLQHSTHIKRNTQPISKGTLNPYQKEHSYYQKELKGTLILSKGTQRNTHIIKRNSLKGTLILSKGTQRNTHIIKRNSLKGTLILSKGTQRNTHIIKRNSLKGTLILSKGTQRTTHLWFGGHFIERKSFHSTSCEQHGFPLFHRKAYQQLHLLKTPCFCFPL